ncbi:hypothetical protein N444_19980 [Escherichia coli O6:H16:CFA/II str. B2C]|nr:hypothetical protein N444_19980 [Escherichia coli O6:H16:CFA/II str. B2C]
MAVLGPIPYRVVEVASFDKKTFFIFFNFIFTIKK